MSPITLRLSGKQEELPFSKLDQEELCNTWRLCTRVKDALEEGSRLENLSWRLWFLQNVLGKGVTPPKPTTAEKIPSLPTRTAVKNASKTAPPKEFENTTVIEPVAPVMSSTTATTMPTTAEAIDVINNKDLTKNFKMHQFSSDQANDPVIPLIDMFGPEGMQEFLDSISDIPMTTTTIPNYLNQSNYNSSNTSFDPNNNFELLDNLFQPGNNAIPQNQQDNCYVDPFFLNYNMISAAASTTPFTAFPNATLHNKLLATLPKQTLQSAERLLAPSNVQPQQKKLPAAVMPITYQHKQHDYYYSTFQTQSKQQENELQQICSNCEATSTPLWRRSADDQLLCNACGLYLKLHNAPRPRHLKNVNRNNKDEFITDIHAIQHQQQQQNNNDTLTSQSNDSITVCNNCATTTTPLWRRDNEGLPLCNACGLYLKLHNEKRPLSLKTDTIKKRQRTDANDEGKRYYERNVLPGTGVLVMSTNTQK